jgi:hypothetical protein
MDGIMTSILAKDNESGSPADLVRQRLNPDDLRSLYGSGLWDETILRMECHSHSADHISAATGVKVQSAGYSIPYEGVTDQTGEPYARWRLRLPSDKMRYVSGKGDDPQLYVPPGFHALPPSRVLVITEGEKKAMKAVQDGIPCVAVQGVWSWADPNCRAEEKIAACNTSADTRPMDALLIIATKYKEVLVLGDSDLAEKLQARAGFEVLVQSLRKRKIRAYFNLCPLLGPKRQTPPAFQM